MSDEEEDAEPMAAAPPAPAPAPAPAPVSEPPGRVLRRHKTALTHGTSIEEKRAPQARSPRSQSRAKMRAS